MRKYTYVESLKAAGGQPGLIEFRLINFTVIRWLKQQYHLLVSLITI